MTDRKGLDQIRVHLTAKQACIIEAHAQLKRAMDSIEIPKSGRWEKRETAVAVLQAVEMYLSTTLDKDQRAGDIMITHQSDQLAVLQDVIRHFNQGKWGSEDPRLAPTKGGAAGAAHDEAMVQFKLSALATVNGISWNLKHEGIKNHKVEARKKVVAEYRILGLRFQNSVSREPEEVDVKLLESWEKRWKTSNRSRDK